MGNKIRSKMPIEERAKQFSPFAAVTGLDKALARKEREMGLEGKRELAEDAAEELNRVLLSLKEGDPVKICYYDEGEYLTVTGSIGFPGGGKQEIIVGDNTINICDIASAERL